MGKRKVLINASVGVGKSYCLGITPEELKGIPYIKDGKVVYHLPHNKEGDKAGVPKDFPKELVTRPESQIYFPTEEEMDEMYQEHLLEDARDIELELNKRRKK